MRVVVVGGGVIGYSVAIELAERGAAVQIVEMRGPGRGATQASAGMLAPYIEGHEATLLRLGLMSLALYDGFVARLDARAGRHTEYVRCGTLEVAYTQSHEQTLRAAATLLVERGVDHRLLAATEIAAIEPHLAKGAVIGLLLPAHGYVHVHALVSSLSDAASRLGVVVREGLVARIDHEGAGQVAVVTEDGRHEASVVVVAAGSWSGQVALEHLPPVPVTPIRGQSLELRYSHAPLSRIVWGEDCYLVPRRDGSLVVGATVEDVGFNESSTPEGVEWLLARAEVLLPSVRAVPREVRIGLRPRTRDQLPLVGPLTGEPRVHLATGHYRNGILLAPLTAKVVADRVFGVEDPQLHWAYQALSPARVGL